MAPLFNPHKTPKQKRPHAQGPVVPPDGWSGSSFTEHRSSEVIPDTPAQETRNSQAEATQVEATPSDQPPSRPIMSPWQHFAATGGAMTPSVERPGGDAISPFFTMGPSFTMGLGPAATTSGAGFSGLGGKPLTSVTGTAPRSHSPHLGGPFAQLTLDGTTSAGGGMSDPFFSLPAPTTTTSKSPPAGEGNRDVMAAALAARRRGSRSGPSALSKSMNAAEAASEPASTSESAPVASGMQLKLPSRMPPPSTSQTTPTALPQPMTPADFAARMHDPHARLLILDLRQPSAFHAGHLAHAVSLPIPSTLLKRQAFTLDKLQDMLSPRSAAVVGAWRARTDVVIVDQDSAAAQAGSVVAGMASKFRAADPAWDGKIWFLKGGMSACRGVKEVQLEYGSDDVEEGQGTDDGEVEKEKNAVEGGSVGKAKMFGGLSRAAFQQGSTRGMARKRAGAPQSIAMPNTPGPLRLDLRGTGFNNGLNTGKHTSRVLANDADGPLDTGTSNATAVAGDRGRRTSAGSSDSPRAGAGEGDVLQPANPFFDNIRQNLELSHGGITERIALNLPPEIASRAHELPSFLRDLVEKPQNETATILANEFENVERDEQRRLQSIMEWHSRGLKRIDEAARAQRRKERSSRRMSIQGDAHGGEVPDRKSLRVQRTQSGMVHVKTFEPDEGSETPEDYFPFSITAGVERGAKNRYKNIWPYDFSRVRLAAKCHDDGSDYINANFIQPQGTTKRYIATQGPLDATFRDFWTLVWEQHVDVIVMLTKQFEGGAIKCGSYWTDGAYGPLHLQLLSTTGGEDAPGNAVSGFDFHVRSDKPVTGTPNIHRVFLLSHEEHPESPPRKITQIQCVSWPDFDVPEDPHTLLGLVKEVDHASEEMAADADDQGLKPPVLVHCSAGVGRTGSYIVVDAMMDALRREHHTHHRKIRGTSQGLSKRRQSRQYEHGIFSPEILQAKADRRGSYASSSEFSVGSLGPPSISPPLQDGSAVGHSPFTPFPALQSFTFSPPATGTPEQMDVDRGQQAEHPTSHQMGRIPEEAGSQQESQEYNLVDEIESIPKITARRKEVLDPSPVLEMSQPVKRILSNMRVQRMSLCQSLRQYLFVYRAIIIGYLDMLDEEKEIEQELHGSGSSSINPTSRPHNHSGATTDEETQTKRRAPDIQLGGSGLTKRPSLKSFGSKRRLRNNNGSDETRLSASTALAASTSSTPSPLLSRPLTPAESRAVSSPEPITLAQHSPHVEASDPGNHDMDTS